MSETKNIGLHLTDSDQERFIDWRREMSGPDNSNMTKIDDAFGKKADKSVPVEGVLTADGWTGESAPFRQILAVEGLTSAHNGSISVAQTATPQQFSAATEALIVVESQRDGELTVAANGDKPGVDIPVITILLG